MLRAAAVLCWLLAAGFGLPDIPAFANVARGDGVWYFMGFPTYGHGPFEQIVIPTTSRSIRPFPPGLPKQNSRGRSATASKHGDLRPDTRVNHRP
jgi:hypothetical protein